VRKRGKKGISTVAGAVLFIILVFAVETVLFLTVYRYNSSVQEAIKTETERMQERIVVSSLLTTNATGEEDIYALLVNNTGGITIHIRAIYIDNQFLCDPSDSSINPDETYVNAKETSWILMPPNVPYNQNSTITAATSRGTKSTDYEWRLKQAGGEMPPFRFDKFYLGPLMLDFVKFYYAKVDPQTGAVVSNWMHGWEVFTGTGPIAWNITVKNIDDRDITLNQFSVFTLWANDQPSNRLPWYIEPPPNSLTVHIKANETVQLVYKWSTPKTNQTKTPNTQSVYNTDSRCRTLLTFFGIFHEPDGTTKPYGQTIPFEAVLVNKAALQVTASPTTIVANSPMYSTIAATLTKNGKPAPGANLAFTTTAGSLSSSWAMTDDTGTARVYLYPGTYPTTATVTATLMTISSSTTVSFVFETIQVTASPNVIPANSTAKSAITAVLKVGANPLAGANLTFTTDEGSLSSLWAITDANGAATVYLSPEAYPATANVTAKWINTLGFTIVQFETAGVEVSASPTVIPTNSTTQSIITALVKLGANPVAGANVTFTTDAGSLSSSWAITDVNGEAIANLTSSMSPENATVNATWMNASGSTIVRFTNLYVTTDRPTYAQNDTVKISGLLRFLNGTPIEGVAVSINITASNGTVVWSMSSSLTDSYGLFTCDLQLISATPDIYTITVTYQSFEEKYHTFTVG